jgi:nucleotide-binding universal stress UspA family protein
MLPKIERILYCTQLGPNTPCVFRYAYSLAKSLPAKLTVLHVVETLTPHQRAMVDGYAGDGVIEHIVEEQEEEQLDRIPRRIGAFCAKEIGDEDWTKIVDRIVVAEGKAPKQILAHIESLKADLVVMGVHGKPSMIENILGGTARYVAQHSQVPVLMCPCPEGKQSTSLDI